MKRKFPADSVSDRTNAFIIGSGSIFILLVMVGIVLFAMRII